MSYLKGEKRKDNWRLTTTQLWTSPTTKRAYWVGSNSTVKGCKMTSKKVGGLLEQCPIKENWTKHNKVSISLYSINQFYLIKENFF